MNDTVVDREWAPSRVLVTMWIPLGILFGLFTFFLFGLLYSLIGVRPDNDELAIDWAITGILVGALLIVHQLIHGLLSRLFGGRPRFDLDVIQWVLPVVSCRVDGQRFSRSQFLLYSLGPLVLPSVLVITLMPVLELIVMLIIPLAVNAGFAIRDIWSAGLVWMQPRKVSIEVDRDRLLFIGAQ